MGRLGCLVLGPDLISSLNLLSKRLADLGRREEALAAVEEALRIGQALARARPAYLSALAGSLKIQAERLAELGRRAEAIVAIDAAAASYERMAQTSPAVFAPALDEARRVREAIGQAAPGGGN